MTADKIEIGERYIITGVTPCDVQLKLTEMGCIKGITIVKLFEAAFRGPIAFSIGDAYTLSMRISEANKIQVQKIVA